MTSRTAVAFLLASVAAATGPRAAGDETTFNRDVAPILFERCAPCHHRGGSGPFDLLTYSNALRHARQIVKVTRSRYMPPWLPEAGEIAFIGERRLDDRELATIRRWVEQGAVEGDPADLPKKPEYDTGWQLGKPDLVATMPRAYTLRAEGPDVYRNFVIPVDVKQVRYVRAVDLDPDNARIVHHARVLLDRTPVSRYRDAESSDLGFDGMDPGAAESPEGHLLGWTPGKLPYVGRDKLAWRLEPGDDLVLQLHMVSTGRPETIRSSLALYFTDRPPTLHPYAMVLGSRRINIPPGEKEYVVEDSYALPVDVDALGIYPHAHYTGKEMRVFARLPGGGDRSLIHIRDWDFNWQDEYRYARPVFLPAGSTIHMVYTYDNSDDNVRNPSSPPRRVVYGPNSTDEMAEVLIQVLPRNAGDLELLRADFERFKIAKAIRFRKELLESNPDDAASHSALASSYVYVGRPDLAIPHFEAALRIGPESAGLHQNAGYALRRVGRLEDALAHYRRAIELDQGSAEARYDLAQTLRALGQLDEALVHYRRVMQSRPESPAPIDAVARILATHPEIAPAEVNEAVRLAERALELSEGRDARLLDTLAAAYAAAGRFDEATRTAQRARTLARAEQAAELVAEIEARLKLYQAGKPYRE